MSSESTNATPLDDEELARWNDTVLWGSTYSSGQVARFLATINALKTAPALADDEALCERMNVIATTTAVASESLSLQRGIKQICAEAAERLHLRSIQLGAVLALCDEWDYMIDLTVDPESELRFCDAIRRAAGIKEGG